MWIDRKTWDDLRLQLAQTHGENAGLSKSFAALETTCDWLRVRVTQLEMERAQLLYNYTGVKVPTPVITKTDTNQHNPMTQTPNFNDVGDAEAARLGVSWDGNGELVYADRR